MEEKDLNNEFNKRKKPAVPKNFFQNFQDKLFDSIEETDANELDFLVKTPKPFVPDNYFKEFSSVLTRKINDGKLIPLFSRKLFISVSAIAAILIIGFLAIPFFSNNSTVVDGELAANTDPLLNLESQEEVVTDEMYNYLAIIDESTLIDYYTENTEDEEFNEFSKDDSEDLLEDDAVIDFIGQDFENIYLDL